MAHFLKSKRKRIIYLLLWAVWQCASAQSGVVATGANATGSGGSVSFSVGEIDYQNYVTVHGALYGGVQHPFEMTTGISATPLLAGDVMLCPNPAGEYTLLRLSDKVSATNYRLLNLCGQTIRREPVTGLLTVILLGEMPSGCYMLELYESAKVVKSLLFMKK